jgi:hypothetical protein
VPGRIFLIGARENLDILNFEVETEFIISLSNNNSKVIRSVVLLITNNQLDDTILTDSRKVGKLIHCSSLEKKSIQLLSAQFKANILSGKSNVLLGGSDNNIRIGKEILGTHPSFTDNNVSIVFKVQQRTLVQSKTIQELVEIIDAKILRQIFINLTLIVRRELPFLKRIDWLIEEKFLSRLRVFSESFIVLDFSFITEGKFHVVRSYH